MGMAVLVLFGVVVWFAIALNRDSAQAKRRYDARQNYLDSLSMLKLDPGNPDLRQRTLGYGRTYSALMREENKSTIFDEMALMNDINAACAAMQQVTAPVAPESTFSRTTDDLEERFLKLQGLKDKGLIDEEAYNKRKSELLAQI